MITGAGLSLFVLAAWNGATGRLQPQLDRFYCSYNFRSCSFCPPTWKVNPTFIMAGAGIIFLAYVFYPFLPYKTASLPWGN